MKIDAGQNAAMKASSPQVIVAAVTAILASIPAPAFALQPNCSVVAPPPSNIPPPPILYDPFIMFFDWDSDAITPPSATILDNVVRAYAELGHCRITITGHTDRSGSDAYNMVLSRRRAQRVGEYLRSRGITAELHYEPFGETRPLVETPDGVHEAQNRRSEIIVGPRQQR